MNFIPHVPLAAQLALPNLVTLFLSLTDSPWSPVKCQWELMGWLLRSLLLPYIPMFSHAMSFAYCLLHTSFICLPYSSILRREATCSSEMSVDFQKNTRRYIPEDTILHILFHFTHHFLADSNSHSWYKLQVQCRYL
jgi:hypothetical protein